MEIRAVITLLIYSLLPLILNYHTKLHLSNPSFAAQGAQLGFMISLFLAVIFRRIPCCSRNFSYFSQSESTTKSFLSASLLGFYLGGYFGINYSIILTACETLSSLKQLLVISHCVMCMIVVLGLVLSDSSFIMRDLFPMILSPQNSKISIKDLLLSMICYIVVADYASTMGVIYFGFFGVIYYCVYMVYNQFPQLSMIALGLFCLSNGVINIFRFFYLRPRLNEIRAEEYFKKNFPFSV